MSFETIYSQFVNELKNTFPEFSSELEKNSTLSLDEKRANFSEVWKLHTNDVAKQNSAIFDEKGIEIIPGIVLTKKLWLELSANTQNAIWKYLSSLLLLVVSESTDGWDLSGFQHDLEEMMKKLKEGGESFGDMKNIFEKISNMASSFGFKDFEDLSGMKDKFKIPERIFKGHIAKIAEELVKEFKPEDFGISPEMLENADSAKVFEILNDIFTKKPEMLATAAQKIGKKIQAKFQRGEINRDEIIAEAEELMKEFSENEMFSSLFGSLSEMMKSSEKSSGNEGSARRREVQERLRKKKADKEAMKQAKEGVQGNTVATTTAQALADAAAASLLLEEETNKKTGRKNKK